LRGSQKLEVGRPKTGEKEKGEGSQKSGVEK